MEEMTIQASTFKARCLAILDDVARFRTAVVITKHGRPVARLVPIDDVSTATLGSVTLLADDDEAFFGTGDDWDADAGRDER